jgi:hypothetical protein
VATVQFEKLEDSISTPTDELILALQNTALYDHPIKDFLLMKTHISRVEIGDVLRCTDFHGQLN